MEVLSRREADILTCVIDTYVVADPPLRSVTETETVALLDQALASSPRLNRTTFRVVLYLFELGPLLCGFGRRLRRLERTERMRWLALLWCTPLRSLIKPVRGLIQMAYYSDLAVMADLGYIAADKLERGRELREREGRW